MTAAAVAMKKNVVVDAGQPRASDDAASLELLHIEELARVLRTDNAGIFRMVRRGRLPARKVSRTDVVMTRAAFTAWIDAPVIAALARRSPATSPRSPAASGSPSGRASPELPRPVAASVRSASRPARRRPRVREDVPLSEKVRALVRDAMRTDA